MFWPAKSLRPGPSPPQTGLARIGVKSGQQVLVIGAADGGLAAAVAEVTGLNGRTLVIDPSPAAAEAIRAAAAEAGALVDFEPTAIADFQSAATFDIAVINRTLAPPNVPADVLRQAAAALRPGGRIIVVEGGQTAGWMGLGRRPIPAALSGAAIRDLLISTGLRAARVLAESEGTL